MYTGLTVAIVAAVAWGLAYHRAAAWLWTMVAAVGLLLLAYCGSSPVVLKGLAGTFAARGTDGAGGTT